MPRKKKLPWSGRPVSELTPEEHEDRKAYFRAMYARNKHRPEVVANRTVYLAHYWAEQAAKLVSKEERHDA